MPDEAPKLPTLEQLADRHLALMDRQMRMMEGLFQQDFAFGGSDILDYLLKNVTQADGANWAPINIPSDRAKAANWPFWRTQQQLDALRQKSRVLVGANSYAGGFLRNIVSHVIGKGGTYKAAPKKNAPQGDWSPLAEATQNVIDDHLKRNRWNCGADPRVNYQAMPTREQEIVRRTFRDGDCMFRAFLIGDGDDRGRLFWRPVEPSAIRNGGARDQEGNSVSCTEADGWDYGIKHRIQPYEDLEDIEAYRVEYLDKSLPNQESAIADAEIVPAEQMIHVKNPDEDAMIGRGTPFFSYDTWDAFYRAGRLETAITVGATIRACTAEYWEYQLATQAQITGLAAGLGKTKENSTGQTEYIEARGPGMVRHGPANRKLVPPVPGGVDENLNALQGALRKAAAAGCAPEYMVTADASNANYSSTKEAGTPFVRWAELLQEHFKAVFLACIWKAVRWAIECKILPPEVMDVIDITCELPKVWQRDSLDVAQEDVTLVQAGIKDRQTCSSERGLDPEQVQRNNLEWQDENGGGMGGMQLPTGMPGEQPPKPAAPKMAESREPTASDGTIRLFELATFDEHKHKRDHGKFAKQAGSSEKDAAKDGGKKSTPESITSKAGVDAVNKLGEQLKPELDANPEVKEHAQSIYNRVSTLAKQLVYDEFPAWAVEHPDIWVYEEILNQAGGPGTVLMAKATRFAVCKAWLTAKKLINKGKLKESAERWDVPGMAKRLHEVMAEMAHLAGVAAPSLESITKALESSAPQ